ncbi:MAG TPA: hypothetical protein VGG89_07605 [Candidatus Baltobacteraceae bacterium]|jgi:hypothetical protein
MEDPFILEARKHKAEADRNGRIALQAFIAMVASFIIYSWHIESDGWWWLFWWASVLFAMRTWFALQERWIRRKSARIAMSFYEYSKR